MFSKLEKAEKRFKEISDEICNIDPSHQKSLHKNLMKELKNLSVIVSKYGEYKLKNGELDEIKEFLSSGEYDKEFKDFLEIEKQSLKDQIEKISEDLKTLLLPKDPNDDRNVIIEIRGGAGGDEAALFSGVLFRMYTMYAQKQRWKIEILNSNETGLGGFKEVSFMVSGDCVYSKLKFESGVHRVQRVPETESQGRVHTSTVTVAVLPEADDVEVDINPSDLNIDTYRASGAGGQHVNKTESAIRITHIPTGTVVECQDERSQYKNKEKAMKILKSRLLKAKQEEQAKDLDKERRNQVGTGDRSERIRTYNFPQNRVTDHRIKLTFHCLDEIIEGNIEKLTEELNLANRSEMLGNSRSLLPF
ncbi:MAG: peptide chain release factor 1 [Firmicutes bacterium]|nr:peptide chain release factor 1 [Bacillota bacterium]